MKSGTTVVISVGGSVIVQDKINIGFLKEFTDLVLSRPERFVVVVGGGGVCRMYIDAVRSFSVSPDDKDWVGIAATHLNAQLVRSVFGVHAYEKIITNPLQRVKTGKRILVGGGGMPGHSTDYDAVELARSYGATRVINVTNVDYLYDSDPRTNSRAKKIEHASWDQLKKIVGGEWKPGLHAPFDPIATKLAARLGLQLVLVGADVKNISNVLNGGKFKGTIVD